MNHAEFARLHAVGLRLRLLRGGTLALGNGGATARDPLRPRSQFGDGSGRLGQLSRRG